MTIVEFLRQRLAEDERIARAAIADDIGLTGDHEDGGFEDATWLDDRSHPRYAHIANAAADLIRATAVPRRVLAEVASKRRLMDGHDGPAGGFCWCNADHPCPTLRILASVYSEHPDYRDEWARDDR